MTRLFVVALVVLSVSVGALRAEGQGPVALSPDGKLRASGDGQTIAITDVATGKVIAKIKAHNGDVSALAYGPGGKRLFSADATGTVCGIDSPTGKLLWKTQTNARVTALGVSPDGKTLSATAGGKAIDIDAATGKVLRQ